MAGNGKNRWHGIRGSSNSIWSCLGIASDRSIVIILIMSQSETSRITRPRKGNHITIHPQKTASIRHEIHSSIWTRSHNMSLKGTGIIWKGSGQSSSLCHINRNMHWIYCRIEDPMIVFAITRVAAVVKKRSWRDQIVNADSHSGIDGRLDVHKDGICVHMRDKIYFFARLRRRWTTRRTSMKLNGATIFGLFRPKAERVREISVWLVISFDLLTIHDFLWSTRMSQIYFLRLFIYSQFGWTDIDRPKWFYHAFAGVHKTCGTNQTSRSCETRRSLCKHLADSFHFLFIQSIFYRLKYR